MFWSKQPSSEGYYQQLWKLYGALYNLVKKSKDERLESYYKKYCMTLTKVIKEAE
jgi:hypothetical protein